MSGFNEIITGALATVAAVAGVTVQYTRGDTTRRLCAVQGRTGANSEDEDFIRLMYEARDWLIEVKELKRAMGFEEPAAGDTITDDSARFEVMPIVNGECFHYMDQNQTRLRIHTKQVV